MTDPAPASDPAAGQTASTPAIPDPAASPPVADPAPGVTPAVAEPAKAPEADPKPAEKEATDKTKDAEKGDKGAVGAPEAYEPFTFPEGVVANETALAEFQATAKELNLSQAAAQRLVDMQSKLVKEIAETNANAWKTTRASWIEQAKADKDIGGQKYEESLGLANRVLKTFGSEALNEVLDLTGAGDHPEMIRLFAKIGAQIGEDRLVTGAINAERPLTEQQRLARMYPSMAAS